MSIPSVKTIADKFGLDKETATLCRKVMEGGHNKRLRREYPDRFAATIERVENDICFTGSEERALSMLNDLVGGYGVEYTGEVDMHDGPPLLYINKGDTYDTTICLFLGDWKVCSWGDIVERNEKLFN